LAVEQIAEVAVPRFDQTGSVKLSHRLADPILMARVRHTKDSPARRYGITPWPVRLGVPILALVVIAGLIHDGAAAATPIPIILAAGCIYGGEYCGLVVTDQEIESRMTRRENRFRQQWTEVDGFELVDNGWQVPIVMRLRNGSRVLLPSTRAWFWNKRKVSEILGALIREQAGAH
jgi:hypothetical protein